MDRRVNSVIHACLKRAITTTGTKDMWFGIEGHGRVRLPAVRALSYIEATREVVVITSGPDAEVITFDAADIKIIGISL